MKKQANKTFLLLRKIKQQLHQVYQKLLAHLAKERVIEETGKLRYIKDPIFIVAMPGCLCELSLCLSFLTNDQAVVVINNGLSNWELGWLKEHLPNLQILQFSPYILDHAIILDFLLHSLENPFGILDYDCFVYELELIPQLQNLQKDELLSALFCQTDNDLGLQSPETFIAWLNPKLIKEIQKKYSVTSAGAYYSSLSEKVKNALKRIGIDEENPIEKYKGYFDTTRLWVCLGYSEGYKVRFVKSLNTRESDGVFHVGAGTSHSSLKRFWSRRGTYFWRRALETCPDEELKAYYYGKYGKMTTADILDEVPEIKKQLGDVYFENVEKIVSQWQEL
ncbi:MAG: hypothetical protein ACOYKC_04475 [Anaerolineaceae bacterium]|jgi:hypothetical protein